MQTVRKRKTRRGSPKRRSPLRNKRVLYGITGSIAAYKAPDLIRRLKDNEASVQAVMTDASSRFITPMTIEAVLGCPVYRDPFNPPMAHINLSVEADLMLVAPATANTIGKFAGGLADDLLSACYMAFRGPVLIAPAMNWRMYASPILQRNLQTLKDNGAVEIPPDEGALACGERGRGRMAQVDTIIEAVRDALSPKDMAGKRVVVTAGPTREYLDEVRFISNRSSGKMGFALAIAARRRGADVTLISGPTAIAPPAGMKFVPVMSAEEMRQAVLREVKGSHMLVMSAAVADFAPRKRTKGKLPKEAIPAIELDRSADILAEVSGMEGRPVLVGFAAEASEDRERARKKLKAKGADMIVLNNIADPGAGFDVDTNKVVIITREGREESLPLMSKDAVADAVLDRSCSFLK